MAVAIKRPMSATPHSVAEPRSLELIVTPEVLWMGVPSVGGGLRRRITVRWLRWLWLLRGPRAALRPRKGVLPL
ncbi:hypothetical protein HD597_009852 [Nonomuraea thailandensis]|uniref:Uncharacterized protein n=1 Tax=Nonomuraea thailandensis TaxID=1188745 RepID=A0A9X2GS17_9ACTN|nr:hypothetical protein [Nonomuraea thailandensis]